MAFIILFLLAMALGLTSVYALLAEIERGIEDDK